MEANTIEKMVYGISTDNDLDLSLISDERFVQISKEEGSFWGLKEFEKEFNSNQNCANEYFIRIL